MIGTVARVVESNQALLASLHKCISERIRIKYMGLRENIIKDFAELFSQVLHDSPQYKSLTTRGPYQLSADFGFEAGAELEYVEPIIEELRQQFLVENETTYGYRADGLLYKLKINFVEKDFAKIISLNNGKYGSWYDSVNTQGVSTRIDWLEWLLTLGDTIQPKWMIVYAQDKKGSRSQEAIMRLHDRGWRVNPAYSGTIDDNWITKSAKIASDQLFIRMYMRVGR
jgi:hypothetical protein